ncbi:MAG: response regulator [Bdellovibrionaceae bacterium]|nr:response regulator [Pseudobdellovibrionaceae bacterium]
MEPKKQDADFLSEQEERARNRLLAALRWSECNFRTLADSMPQIVWTTDGDGRLTYCNKQWFDYSGYPPGPPEVLHWESVIHPEDLHDVLQAWRYSVETGTVFSKEYRLRRHGDGSYRWHLARALPARDDQGEIIKWFGTCTDVHDFKKLSEQLEQARREAEAANAAKSAFLANMSHEIRTPLGAILGFIDLLKQPDLPLAERNEYIAVLDRNSEHLLHIVDDILDLSKVEAGKIIFENRDFNLIEMLSDFCSMMGMRAREKGIAFSLKALTTLPEVVNSDAIRLRQILTNVVGNAIKFTERGQVEVKVSAVRGELQFRVSDTGRGIPPEQRERLFQPFVQADSSTTRKFGGTGLGLVLTRRLSEGMGGRFELIDSEPERGSVFLAAVKVRIPEKTKILEIDNIDFSATRAAPVLTIERHLQGLKVLLVEDSPDNQVLIRKLLDKAGAQVDVAGDGQEGVEKAFASEHDVILMDIQMPRMDGHEAAVTLRERGYGGPLIALTAHAMKEEQEKCERSGFSHFLSKPLSRQDLLNLLARLRRPSPGTHFGKDPFVPKSRV